MNLCAHNHEEVCYEGRNCPACEAIADLEAANQTIEAREETIKELNEEIDNLKANQ